MSEHISKQFDAELESVRSRVLQMGGLVEEQILRAVEALDSGDMERIDKVIADDHRVNALEVGLDEACSHIIARRQPAAGDLRLLIAVIKTITDLERIGDEAQRIGILSARLAANAHPRDRYDELKSLSEHVQEMVESVCEAMEPEVVLDDWEAVAPDVMALRIISELTEVHHG